MTCYDSQSFLLEVKGDEEEQSESVSAVSRLHDACQGFTLDDLLLFFMDCDDAILPGKPGK